MNTEKVSGLKSNFEGKKEKKRKYKKYRSVRFNQGKFILILSTGLASAVIGLWLIWTTKTNPDDVSSLEGYPNTPSFISVFPESTLEIFAFIVGNLCVLFGVICIFKCLKLVVQYIAGKFRN